ncbi:MAG: cysteine desulfurase [Bacteroidetes bacterium]|nr:MAG: cysteine desulfurase [Bacteroidota bacterium]PTM11364.1 MAG: cysteine desulfurase [Bacteroidota bacterium]
MKRIYLDNAATTPLDPAVIAAMLDVMQTQPGNPSSIHAEGRQARTIIEQARRTVARHLKASIGEIFFTSGGTEANNMALKGAVRDLGVRRIISAPTEHHCVLHSLERIGRERADVTIVHVNLDQQGSPDLGHLEELLADHTLPTLVSLMHANNEIGTLVDLTAVGELCRAHGAYFHSDTVQTIGFYPIDVSTTPIHFLSGSAHKFHGPKGVGFIYINSDHQIQPFIDGGAQERNMRGGTENTYGIAGLAKALELAGLEQASRATHMRSLRTHLRNELLAFFPEVAFSGDVDNGHYKLLNLRFPPTAKTELLLFNLDIAGISVSGGSACSSGTDTGSHVIRALYGDADDAVNIRVSFSHLNTLAEVDQLLAVLRQVMDR